MATPLSLKSLRVIKPEIRVLGVDDGQFVPRSKTSALVVGVVLRGGGSFEGIMGTQIEVDGLDATDKIGAMIMGSPHYRQLRVVMLNGVTFGGFNVVDLQTLHAQTGLPVLAVTGKKPNMTQVRLALEHLPDSKQRWQAIQNAGEMFKVETKPGKKCLYVEAAGITQEKAVEVLRLTSTRSRIPEPLRVAHLIASGISLYL
jgi:uncharacterized protein